MIKNNSVEVKRQLKAGRSPILPFEGDILRSELVRLGVEQGELGRLIGEAMEQSSETWHDNAPADAINYQSRILTGRAEQVIADLGSAVLLDYPEMDDPFATLGSVVGVQYRGGTAARVLLTGMCRAIPDLNEGGASSADLEVATARSPLGRAVLGLEAGITASYQANGRTLAVNIVDVTQLSPAHLLHG